MEQRQDHQRPTGGGTSAPVVTSAELSSIRFARLARALGSVAQEEGLRVPAFRSPPRVAGMNRSIRRRADGSCTVAVALRHRPAVAVVADMIDGVVAANRQGSGQPVPASVRDRLWSAALPLLASGEDAPVETGHKRAA